LYKPPIPVLLLDLGDDGGMTDLRGQFAIAKAYADTAHIAGELGESSNLLAMAFPAFICSSFALELFMKLLVVRGRIAAGGQLKRADGHNVKDLWREIPEQDQVAVAGFFRNESRSPRSRPGSVLMDVFERSLNDLDDRPFVEWRYVHERKGVELLRHGQLVEVLDAFGRAAAYLLTQDGLAGVAPSTGESAAGS